MHCTGYIRVGHALVLTGLVVAGAAWPVESPPAAAGARGSNARIAFASSQMTAANPEGDYEIFTMAPDGTDLRELTKNAVDDIDPAWSPNGDKIVFVRSWGAPPINMDIFTMTAEGRRQTRLTRNPTVDVDPAWSPDGKKIAFASNRDGHDLQLFVMRADGGNQTDLVADPPDGASDRGPAWSPDGKRIAISRGIRIYVVGTDGSDPTNLTEDSRAHDFEPTWSPDGETISFATNRDGNNEIYAMSARGANPTNLTNDAAIDEQPDWRRERR
jgi:Tol biopolymer transport system component